MRLSEYQAELRDLSSATDALAASRWTGRSAWLAGGSDQSAVIVAAAQARAAALAEPYLLEVVGAGERIIPSAFARTAADGRPLGTLMRHAAFAAPRKAAEDVAEEHARLWLSLVTRTQVADAGRSALRAGMAVRNASGVRIAHTPCCPRCAILHGRYYPWKADFLRHPNCGCTYEVVADGAAVPGVDEIPLDQIRGLSKADRDAIELGADRVKVINAHRGMYTTTIHGKTVKATHESTRGLRAPRLRPESILANAKDQADAVRLLRRFGYIR